MGGTTTLTMPDVNGHHIGPNPPNVQQPSSIPAPDSNTITMPDDNGYQLPTSPTMPTTPPAPPQNESIFQKAHRYVRAIESNNLESMEYSGVSKEALSALGGLTDIINEHLEGKVSPNARQHMQKAAAWMRDQGQLRGWGEEGGIGEHMGAMGADYLGYEGLLSLLEAGTPSALMGEAGTGAAAKQGAKAALAESETAKTTKNVWNLAQQIDQLPKAVQEAFGIGMRTIHAATAGYGQQYVMSGGDTAQARDTALLTGMLHLGAGVSIAPLAKYVSALESEAKGSTIEKLKNMFGTLSPELNEAIEQGKPLPPYKAEAPGEAPGKFVPPPFAAPTPPAQQTIPVPAAERAAAAEREAAQSVTRSSLEDQNRYRTVDQYGTPTNIQQLGLPSQSAGQPYQFRVPGWSQTVTEGDLLHDPAAGYRQVGTRVVEGKGSANLKPWEAQNIPFNPLRYAETPGAVVNPIYGEGEGGVRTAGTSLMPEPPPTREPAEPPTSGTSHREPIYQATDYRAGLREGADIRHEVTTGGPSILSNDPYVAASHLENINRVVDAPNFTSRPIQQQMAILESRADVARQLTEYQRLQPQAEYSPYLHQPTFEPMGIEDALKRTGDLNNAADEMARGPKAMYQQWTELTRDRPGGSFQDINEEINDLRGKTGQANRLRLAELEREMDSMFSGNDPYLGRAGTPIDLAIARTHFNDSYLTDRIGNVFTDAYKGAERTGEFDVNRLQRNWKGVANDVGPARMRNLLGPERYEYMNGLVNDLAEEPGKVEAANKAARETYRDVTLPTAEAEHEAQVGEAKEQHEAIKEKFTQDEAERVARNKANKEMYAQLEAARNAKPKQQWYYDLARNGWHHIASKAGMEAVANIAPRGALAGMSAGMGKLLVLKAIATHPAMAKIALQGAKLGASPSVYGPIIGDMVRYMSNRPEPTPVQPETQPATTP